MIKFLHLGDLHLDTPFTGMNIEKAKDMSEAQRNSFSAAIEYASKENISIVLISGDLFDSEYYSKSTLDFISRKFESCPECKFVISPGNHDPYNSSGPYYRYEFPENVHVFKSETISSVKYPSLNATVYGYAFTSDSYTRRPLSGFCVPYDGSYNIMCAHGDTESPLSKYAPITKSDIAMSRLDYIALGHIHTKPEILSENNTYYTYSGCLCGRDFSEYGEKGGVLVTLDNSGGRKTTEVKRVRFCPWIFSEYNISLSGAFSENEAKNIIFAAIEENKYTQNFTRINLSGIVSFKINLQEIKAALKNHELTIRDKTINLKDFSSLEGDYSLKGEFYRALKDKLESTDPSEQLKAFRALKLGLEALSGTNAQNLI